jgi:hypothetical protein
LSKIPADAGAGAAGVIGTVLSDRYRLDSKLGTGGMSTVYLARDETLDRLVAVKVMHREISDQPDQLERFNREARAVAQISHPNVVSVIDAGEDGGHPYIVFEYVEGETLKQRITRMGRLPLDEAVAYAIEIGRGLGTAHARRLVHRDVKPQNVLIDAEGRAKVTDFGIARSLEAEGLTATGRVLGTTDYVSPEQAMGHAVDARSDIYSLGIVLYEMLTGEVPYRAESLVGVAMKHVNEPMPDISDRRPEISAVLASVVERSTAKDPVNRYSDVAQMLLDLEQALQVEVARAGASTGEATTVLESVPEPRRRLRPRRRGIASALAALAIAAAVVGAIVLLSGGGGSGPASAKAKPIHLSEGAAHDFDPTGDGGDGVEHSDEVGLAVDGNPNTPWSTETYQVQDFGTKPGVGLYVDAGHPVSATEMRIRTPESGWDAEIYGAPGTSAPETLDGWTQIGAVSSIGGNQTIPLNTGAARYRFYLVWITKLAASGEGYSAEIGDIELLGS